MKHPSLSGCLVLRHCFGQWSGASPSLFALWRILAALIVLLLAAPVIRLASLSVIVLATVFTMGNLLADASVREPNNGQIIIAANVKNPPAVAAKVRTPFPWPRQEWQSQNPAQGWHKKTEPECFLGILPDTGESESDTAIKSEAAIEDAANCFKCPRLCGYFHYRNSSDEAGLNPPFLYPDSDMTIHIPTFSPTPTPNGGTSQ